MPSKPPYFPLYVRDFAADGKVEAMSTLEVGAYFRLLLKAWHEEPAGSIPNSDAILARWARLEPVVWAECRTAVLAPFALGSDGRFHQKRMRQEYQKLRNVVRAKSEGGKKGAQKRWEKCSKGDDENGIPNGIPITNPMGMPMASGYGSLLEGIDSLPKEENTKTSSNKKKNRGDARGADFNTFWQAFPRHNAEQAAAKAWKRLKPDAELQAEIMAALASPFWRDQDPNFVPYAATWLNGRRWEDKPLPFSPSRAAGRSSADSHAAGHLAFLENEEGKSP